MAKTKQKDSNTTKKSDAKKTARDTTKPVAQKKTKVASKVAATKKESVKASAKKTESTKAEKPKASTGTAATKKAADKAKAKKETSKTDKSTPKKTSPVIAKKKTTGKVTNKADKMVDKMADKIADKAVDKVAKKSGATSQKETDKIAKKKANAKNAANKKKLVFPFKVGEYIFYPNEGLGLIIGTEDIDLRGELTPYYVISFPAQKMTNRVPVHNCKLVKIRRTISRPAAKNVLKIFENEPEKTDMSWKDRLTMYQTINEKGNCTEIAQMLVSLFYRRQTKNNLSFQERQVFDFSVGALSNELAVVLGISNQQAMEEITSRLHRSYDRFRGDGATTAE